ncbi:hypothetical protein N7466_008920 [Penicillium verhagenii]|uniref:uncharacterized protein n=1 Tax=Penicillium verhagenii TaxID=1562060 RepID=UPI002545101B|nr:uncharacterized protein N7466_008920 [Penicillium verhagenii]KAJ5924733.1 hypothetical protein N7466_008920 [Penicillium verhagenii]
MAELHGTTNWIISRCESLSLLQSLVGVVVVGLCLGSYHWFRQQSLISTAPKNDQGDIKYPHIVPLQDFDWKNTEPLQFRPFRGKEKYNLTMAIETLDPSDLIPMDKTYKDRLALRKQLLNQHHDIVVAVNDTSTADARTHSAVHELYSFIMATYLPSRYPGMFKLHPSTNTTPAIFENTITGASWPTRLSPETPTIRALEILAQTVDEEFLILLPDISASEHDPKYILQAYGTCFPSGFNTREKLGLRLADIHTPVPGYADKIERSMDRFFAKIEVGKFVKRVNWSVTTETELFAAFGSVHGSHVSQDRQGENLEKEERALRLGELNIDETVLRCERQTLHRLPDSKALVFSFHTYIYPIRQIKDEGLGEEFAVAIDGIKKGNVPGMHAYKRGNYWGEAVKEFLRS